MDGDKESFLPSEDFVVFFNQLQTFRNEINREEGSSISRPADELWKEYLHFLQRGSYCTEVASYMQLMDMRVLCVECFISLVGNDDLLASLWQCALSKRQDPMSLTVRAYRVLGNIVQGHVALPFSLEQVLDMSLSPSIPFLEKNSTLLPSFASIVQYWDAHLQKKVLELLADSSCLGGLVQLSDPEWCLSALCLSLKQLNIPTKSIEKLCVALLQQALKTCSLELIVEQTILRFSVLERLGQLLLDTIGNRHFTYVLSKLIITLSDRSTAVKKPLSFITSMTALCVYIISKLKRSQLSSPLQHIGSSLDILITITVSSLLDNSNQSVRICGMKIGKCYGEKVGFDLEFEELKAMEELEPGTVENKGNDRKDIKVLGKHHGNSQYDSKDSDAESESELEGYDKTSIGNVESSSSFGNHADLKMVPELNTNYLSVCLELLNASENDQYIKLKHTAALKRIPIIMENFPADASDYCENLLETLLNMSNSLSIEEFEELKLASILSLSKSCPATAIKIIEKFLLSTDVGLGTKIFCLTILQRISEMTSSEKVRNSSPIEGGSEASTENPASKTIIKRPKKLAQLHTKKNLYHNNFIPVCESYFALVLRCLQHEYQSKVIKSSKKSFLSNSPSNCDFSDFDMILTKDCIITLTVFLRCLRNSPHQIKKFCGVLLPIFKEYASSSTVSIRKAATVGFYFIIDSIVTLNFNTCDAPTTLLGILENISTLQITDSSNQNEHEEMLLDPLMVEFVEQLLETYPNESDEDCRNIIAKIVHLYKRHAIN